jgi:hypothetical protein
MLLMTHLWQKIMPLIKNSATNDGIFAETTGEIMGAMQRVVTKIENAAFELPGSYCRRKL